MNEHHEYNNIVPESDCAALERAQRRKASIPELPNVDFWTPAQIADYIHIEPRRVRAWCIESLGKSPNRKRRKLTREQAQRVVNRMFTFGYKNNPPT